MHHAMFFLFSQINSSLCIGSSAQYSDTEEQKSALEKLMSGKGSNMGKQRGGGDCDSCKVPIEKKRDTRQESNFPTRHWILSSHVKP